MQEDRGAFSVTACIEYHIGINLSTVFAKFFSFFSTFFESAAPPYDTTKYCARPPFFSTKYRDLSAARKTFAPSPFLWYTVCTQKTAAGAAKRGDDVQDLAGGFRRFSGGLRRPVHPRGDLLGHDRRLGMPRGHAALFCVEHAV